MKKSRPTAMAVPRTMADVDAMLPGLGYTESSEANVRAAIRKCRKAYKQPDLSKISADPALFEAKWGTGRVSFLAPGFKSLDQFTRWRKDVRAALGRAGCGTARTSAQLIPACDEIVTVARENQGRGKLLGANTDLTLGVLAREASADGRLPTALDLAWIDARNRSLRGEPRKQFKRGVRAMNRVIAVAAVLPEIADLLPIDPLPEPAPLRDPSTLWLRSAGHPGAATLWREFDEIVQRKRFGEGGPQIKGEPAQFRKGSADAYGRALEWLTKGLALAEVLDADDEPDLSELITHANLVAATNNWIARREARGLPTDKGTLHGHITKLVHIATAYLPISEKERRRLVELRRNKRVRTQSVGRMSASREGWMREFDASPAQRRAASRMPEILQKRARAILARVGTERPPAKDELMSALRSGVAAAMAAVLFRASPIRAANLRHLRFQGENPDFRMADDRNDARVTIPGSRTKNGAFIDDPSDDDLMPIVDWYLCEIRPRLIAEHPYNRPFNDSDHLFPSTTPAPMERTMCAAWYAIGCEEAGVPMTLHQARHVSAYWILKIDPDGWGDAAAVLHVDEMTVRKHYGWMNEQRATEAGRAKLREARKATRKHTKGEFENAA